MSIASVTNYEPVRLSNGELKRVVIEVPLHALNLAYCTSTGEESKTPWPGQSSNNIIVRIPGVSELCVERVDFPPIDMGGSGEVAYARVTLIEYVGLMLMDHTTPHRPVRLIVGDKVVFQPLGAPNAESIKRLVGKSAVIVQVEPHGYRIKFDGVDKPLRVSPEEVVLIP